MLPTFCVTRAAHRRRDRRSPLGHHVVALVEAGVDAREAPVVHEPRARHGTTRQRAVGRAVARRRAATARRRRASRSASARSPSMIVGDGHAGAGRRGSPACRRAGRRRGRRARARRASRRCGARQGQCLADQDEVGVADAVGGRQGLHGRAVPGRDRRQGVAATDGVAPGLSQSGNRGESHHAHKERSAARAAHSRAGWDADVRTSRAPPAWHQPK